MPSSTAKFLLNLNPTANSIGIPDPSLALTASITIELVVSPVTVVVWLVALYFNTCFELGRCGI
jgi:hypothetical protein